MCNCWTRVKFNKTVNERAIDEQVFQELKVIIIIIIDQTVLVVYDSNWLWFLLFLLHPPHLTLVVDICTVARGAYNRNYYVVVGLHLVRTSTELWRDDEWKSRRDQEDEDKNVHFQ